MKPFIEYLLTIILFAVCFLLIQFILSLFLTITFNLLILFLIVLVVYPVARIGATFFMKKLPHH